MISFFVEYLCNRSPKIKTKNFKNYISMLTIVSHRNWLDVSSPFKQHIKRQYFGGWISKLLYHRNVKGGQWAPTSCSGCLSDDGVPLFGQCRNGHYSTCFSAYRRDFMMWRSVAQCSSKSQKKHIRFRIGRTEVQISDRSNSTQSCQQLATAATFLRKKLCCQDTITTRIWGPLNSLHALHNLASVMKDLIYLTVIALLLIHCSPCFY